MVEPLGWFAATNIMKKRENILIYRLGSLGDTIMALPAFHGVRRAFPDSKITLLTNRPVSSKAAPLEAILGRGIFFDGVLDYPVGIRNPSTLWALLRKIRSLDIGMAINLAAFRSDFSTTRDKIFFRAAGISKFAGFDLRACDKSIACDPVTGETEWEACRISRRIEKIISINLNDPANWDLKLSRAENEMVRTLLAPWNPAERLLAFSTGTKVQSKHWGIEKWRKLAEVLAARLPDWKAVFLGSPEEALEAESCATAWGDRSVNLCGRATPRESAAVLSGCRGFVGHDSGPMHLAACMGVPCVAVFSARNIPRQWFPRGTHNKIIQRRPACAGCGLEVCLTEGKKCLTEIPVHEVAQAVLDSVER